MNYPVRYNHLGYTPEASKTFFVDVNAFPCKGSFSILDEQGKVVFEGSLREGSFGHKGICDYSGETLWTGDFSAVKEPGSYRIMVVGKDGSQFKTERFEISNSWILAQAKANIKSFFYQRSGVELKAEFAGPWARPAAHLDDNIGFHPMMERDGSWNAHGGWYDAGDYGKYIVNGGISVGTLLLACQMAPDAAAVNVGGTFDLPYSLKEETRFELEFFLRMQYLDGGVFFKVTPERWDGFISPHDSDMLQKRLVLGKSTTSTLNFAGAVAQASCVFRKDDRAFADCCLDAAIRAYGWAVENPAVGWPRNTEGSGGYGDEHYDDEFFWTRAALFCALNAAGRCDDSLCGEVRKMLPADMDKNPAFFGMDWRDTQNMGWALLALQEYDRELQQRAQWMLDGVAGEILKKQNEDAYGLSIRKFIWGSNGEIANHALTLLIVNQWKKDDVLRSASLEMMHFVYGRNPVNTCFVTGAAWSSPMHPHHRLSHSDGVEEPIPGLVVGGINADRQDGHRAPHYPSDLPGLSYTDERCSFASNEIAINWSSPLTAVLLLLS
ncbi:glycoside hydrolase family 9 protein [Fibrobacter sp. UWEL]|uniref:glycoside hydrolase family 9 protein n=1 Tax=Fibrobacter sp. UWEL TaxID=1896209 RepID=UPI000916705F|nr:glycoside hydrolase family 9 protein [Fibrobacter sp. UWEL]SHK67212.1 endoglucanase [Fibrobacter sp. UWEL]